MKDQIKNNYGWIVMYLILLLITLLALLYVSSIQEDCNEHWIKEFERRCDNYGSEKPNLSEWVGYYDIEGVEEDETKDISKDT